MIQRIIWPRPDFDGFPSPFDTGKNERTLKITFHTSTLSDLSDKEAAALEALQELCHLAEVQSLHTENGPLPRIEIKYSDPNFDGYLVDVRNADGSPGLRTGIWYRDQWPRIATELVGGGRVDHPNAKAMLTDLIIAQAHRAVSHDILVTTSPWLLDRRTESSVDETNPRLPSEAAQIVGLFLRSRGNYTYRAGENSRAELGGHSFYWVLARHRLPSMWRYFSACLQADKVRADDTFGLAESILKRCVRAIQARDSIGEQFYTSQPRESLDTMMYHFDYLTLLLTGALDAQARIAHRAYKITKPSERRADFRGRDFQKSLEARGAKDLYDLVSGTEFRNLATLVYELRNTIHGAGLKDLTISYSRQTPEIGYARLSQRDGEELWQAADCLGSPERWGLRRNNITMLEPYMLEPFTYSSTLVQECLKMIDKVAAVTDVEGLFPDGHQIPKLMDKPPEDGIFVEHVRQRLAVLG